MRIAALFTVLSKKFKDEEIIFVDSLAQSAIKTKTAMDVITNISKGAGIKDLASAKKARALVALSEKNTNIQKSFRNIPSLEMAVIQNINPMQLLNQKYLIIENPEVAIAFLTSKLEK